MAEPALKMSLHAQSASSKTAAHNDRSMYKDPATYRDRGRNRHGDWLGGTSSDKAERAFYEQRFRADLDAINAGYVRNHHPEKCMGMDAYRERHPLHEIIWQIGRKDARYDGDQRIYDDAIAIITDHVERAGGTVVSWDLHMDETTPHFHVRCAFAATRATKDAEGNPIEVETLNVDKCLAAHGVALPDPTKGRSQHNCRIKTWTKELRDDLEDMSARYVERAGATLDMTPDKGNVYHEDMPRFRSRRQQQERFNELTRDNDRLRAENDRLSEGAERQRAQLAEVTRQLDQALRLAEEAKAARKDYEAKSAELDGVIARSEEVTRALDDYAGHSYEGVVTRAAVDAVTDMLYEEAERSRNEDADYDRGAAFDDAADYIGAASAYEDGKFFARIVERVREALRKLVADIKGEHDEAVRVRDDARSSGREFTPVFEEVARVAEKARRLADAPESDAEAPEGPDGPDMG